MSHDTRSPGAVRGFSLVEGPLIEPLGVIAGRDARDAIAAGAAHAIDGGRLAFTLCRVLGGESRAAVLPAAALAAWCAARDAGTRAAVAARLERLAAPRAPFAGLTLDRPRIMGVVNVTPDSFSDGGVRATAAAAIAHGRALARAGADIIDVGGESTRPGAPPTPPDVERDRVVPVVAALAGDGLVVSADTRRASVMTAALGAGARVVNDITALGGDPDALGVVAAHGASVVLMHMQGTPATMQVAPRYDDVARDVHRFLAARVGACLDAGIAPARIAVDPGIGFGKTAAHNATLLARLALLHTIGCPILLGVSRKSFIAALSAGEPATDRLPGTIAALIGAAYQGVHIHRVHDVAEVVQALAVLRATIAAGGT